MGQVTHNKSYSKIYRTWIAMISRCTNPNDNNYKNYGGRGIIVDESWRHFENFFADMGDLPFYEAQLDRIDNNKGYFKENCKWSSPKENARNRRTTKKHKTYQGDLVQQELIEKIGWSKDQFRWYSKRYGISWILEKFKEGLLPQKKNRSIDPTDLVGQTFGEWKTLSFVSYARKTGHLYLCRCGCGMEKTIARNNLIKGKTKMCRSCAAFKMWKEKH